MKKNQVCCIVIACIMGWGLWPLSGSAQVTDFSPDMNELLSHLESMGQGYHTEKEWTDLFSHIDRMLDKAGKSKDWNTVVEVDVIKAMVLSDMLGDNRKALSVLQETKRQYLKTSAPALKKVFVGEAEMYSRLGDEAAVSRVIEEFKKSKVYDREQYSYSGGSGRDTPLTIVRPKAGPDGSISVTSMERYRNQARLAPGSEFPDFQATDMQGRDFRLADYRGKVVLLDFWAKDWTPWKRELANLVKTYQRYNSYGFEIIGIDLDVDTSGLSSFVSANQMTWPQIAGDTTLTKKLGIFGEATNFLLDQSGMVIGRNVTGADLVTMVKRSLDIQ